MTRVPQVEGRHRTSTVAPRLELDLAIGIAVTLLVAFFARRALNPDGVAYLELAEAAAAGRWGRLLQGYWSPGLPALLAPLAWITGPDRSRLLVAAHGLQALLGGLALWLGAVAIRRNIPPALQRVAWWAIAWVVIRWLSQVLVTPDLLLSVAVLAGIVLLGTDRPAARFGIGAVAGLAFLAKPSIWPWLVVAGMVAGYVCWRSPGRRLPWLTFAGAAGIIGAWLVALSVREGRPTLGSVGPLSFQWYLGDLSRRTPDTDRGSHSTRRSLPVPPPTEGTVVFFEIPMGTDTYLPWSDPERWARGVPPDARPRFNRNLAVANWLTNLRVAATSLLPLLLGIMVFTRIGRPAGTRHSWIGWLGDRPILIVGIAASVVFLVIHAELRLLAPAALLCILGGLASKDEVVATRDLRAGRIGAMIVLALEASSHIWTQLPELDRRAATDATIERFIKQVRPTAPRGIVVAGPAMPMMTSLWANRLRVVAQFDNPNRNKLLGLPPRVLQLWLQRNFAREAAGMVFSSSSISGNIQRNQYQFMMW